MSSLQKDVQEALVAEGTLENPAIIEELWETHFWRLLFSEGPGPSELSDFEQLIELGVFINKLMLNRSTPLMYCILYKKVSFIKILLKHGAEVNKPQCFHGQHYRTPLGLALGLAVRKGYSSPYAYTRTEHLYQRVEFKIVKMLLEHGADFMFLNIEPDEVLVDFLDSFPDVQKLLAKESAKFSIGCEATREKNLRYSEASRDLQKSFTSCLDELERMKSRKLYNGISLYDVLKMRKFKLIMMVRNEQFVEAFKSGWNRESFDNYREDLDALFEEAVKRELALATKTKKLHEIFKDSLPQLIIERISYFMNHYFFW